MKIIKNILAFIIGILGLSMVIVIHEMGHFLAAQYFGVAAPVFSIGFGPVLFSYKIGQTLFQIAALPLGGYVVLSPEDLALLSYGKTVFVMLAGVLSNILFSLPFLWYLVKYRPRLIPRSEMEQQTDRPRRSFIGPIGIIALVVRSVKRGPWVFMNVLAILSFNIGIFNLFPLPFLDGGKVLIYSMQTLFSMPIQNLATIISFILLALLLLFFIIITIKDLIALKR